MDVSKIAAALAGTDDEKDLPVEKWNPQHCGDIDILIKTDGSWFHLGTPIGRPQLVRLFSRVLRHDPDGYVLVTPAEKLSIDVEDVPFVVTDFDRVETDIRIRTNVGDQVTLGPDHPLELRKPPQNDKGEIPYVLIRGDLWARFGRPSYYRLINGESCEENGHAVVKSGGMSFDLGALP